LEEIWLNQLVSFPLTLTGCQMGGWFKKEVKSLEDLRDLRMRISGLGAEVLSRFGVTTDFAINNNRVIAVDPILPLLRTDLDAAE
jgi:TRAP-type mannitol/chloroaromatic compound transport system substrate-binding protein